MLRGILSLPLQLIHPGRQGVDITAQLIQYRIENAGADDQIPHGFQRPVDLGVVGVEVYPLHLVRGLPLGEPIILSLSSCHKKSLLS